MVGGVVGLTSGVIGIGGDLLLPVQMLGGGPLQRRRQLQPLFRLAELHGWTDWCRSGGRLDLDHSLLVPFALAVLAGGLVGLGMDPLFPPREGLGHSRCGTNSSIHKRVLDNLL